MGFNTLQCSSRQRPRLEIRRLKKNISFDRSTEKGVLDYLFSDSKDRQVDHRMDRLVWVAVNFCGGGSKVGCRLAIIAALSLTMRTPSL